MTSNTTIIYLLDSPEERITSISQVRDEICHQQEDEKMMNYRNG
jgi:hypothetical protein